jgi:hypothetical protein
MTSRKLFLPSIEKLLAGCLASLLAVLLWLPLPARAQSGVADIAQEIVQSCIAEAKVPGACTAALSGALIVWGIAAIASAGDAYSQREYWFHNFIDNAAQSNPNLNTLAIATYNNVPGGAKSGVGQVTGDCGHSHFEIPMSAILDTTQGVEIYTVGPNSSCSVEKWGDGGWSNWGYYGNWTRTTTDTGSQVLSLTAATAQSPPPTPPTPVLIPGGTIPFNRASYGGWQTGCHYPNTPNIATIQLTADNHDCGATCASTTSCNFFVKTTDGPHGTCYLKSLPGTTFATPGDPNYYVCGYVDR